MASPNAERQKNMVPHQRYLTSATSLLIACLLPLSFCALSLSTLPSNKFRVKKHIFHAIVDHYSFRPTTPTTFPLRYYVNDDYYTYNSSSPCFFYAGNEADIWQFINNSGFLFEAAQEFGALVVFAEHRYYGESKIDGNDDMSFLTVEQAMADFNTLNVYMRYKWHMECSSAFVVFGGSYGGNLAMWLRLKNPNLWAGAIASSATPLKHVLRETNNFTRIETEVYGNVSSLCPDLVRRGLKELYGNATSSEGRATIAKGLNLCHPLSDASVADSIHGWIIGALETMVQYGYPYPTEFYNPLPGYPFRVACEGMLQAGTGLGALLAAANVYYNHTGQAGPCFELGSVVNDATKHWQRKGQQHHLYRQGILDDKVIEEERPLQAEELLGDDDAWGYQTCTEVYQPMPCNGITDFEIPHTPNKTQYYARCRRRWNVEPRPDWEEMHFMGSHIAAGSNIFLASGQLDPWRAAGIQEVPKGAPDSIVVRIIENGAHHLDLRESNPLDPPSVVSVRLEQTAAMRRWIDEWKENACD